MSSSSGGSTESIDDIRKNYRIHLGPFYVKPAVLLKELGVDNNVLNQAAAPQADFMFIVEPQADIAVPLARRGLIRTTVGTDLVYYHKFASERSVDPQVAFRVEAYAHRVTLFVQGSYLNTRQRPNYEIDLRSRHLQNDFSAGGSVRLTPKFAIEVAGLKGATRYDGDAVYFNQSLKESLDRDSTGFSVTARNRWTPLTTFALQYEQQHDSFPYTPLKDTDSYRIMPGVEFKPRALIKGSAFVGFRNFMPKTALIPEYAGLVARLALSYTLLGATTFGVSYDRDANYSFDSLTPYYIDNSVGVFVRRQLSGRYDVIVNAARHRYAYRHLTVLTESLAPPPERTETTDNFGANLGYRMKGQTRLGFGASYFTRSSTVATFREYDGLRIGMSVTYGF